MPSKKKANNDESRAEDLPALDSVSTPEQIILSLFGFESCWSKTVKDYRMISSAAFLKNSKCPKKDKRRHF